MTKPKKPKHHALQVNSVYRTRDGGRCAIISTTNKDYGDKLPVIAHKEGIGYAPPYTMGRDGRVYPDQDGLPGPENAWDILDATPISAVQFR